MRGLRAWWLRLVGSFRQERPEQELAEELRSHLRLHMDENMRAGMSPEQARRDALLKLGGVEATKGALPRAPRPAVARNISSGRALCLAHAAEKSRIHLCGGAYFSARHWREYRHLQRGERRASPPAAVQEFRAHDYHPHQNSDVPSV